MNRVLVASFFVCLIFGFTHCGASLKRDANPGQWEEGLAAYYADSLHGNPTASGEIYDKLKFTAAHRELAFGTVVRVTSLSNRRAVNVKINDRGPFGSRKRIIDLSKAAAASLDMIRAGVVSVRVEIVSVPEEK